MRSISIGLICILCASSHHLRANDFDIAKLQTEVQSTIEAVTPAVVSVGIRGSGFSGVIVSPEGHVLSAGHAVRPGQFYRIILPDGRRFSARVMGSNKQLDCALIKIDKPQDLPWVPMGNSSQLVTNQPCLSLSYPSGARGDPVVRFGRIVRKRTGTGMVQSTALMEPGDSGGPLFDLNGHVIAIHSRIGRSMLRNFDVPIDTYRKYWQELNRAQEFVDHLPPQLPKLGFSGEETEDGDGLFVFRVKKNSPSDKAGLQIDDLIIEIQEKPVASIRQMRRILRSAVAKEQTSIAVAVLREGHEEPLALELNVTIQKSEPTLVPEPPKAKTPAPTPLNELASLPEQFAELENRLDDQCVTVTSSIDDERTPICAMLIANTRDLITKNSRVGRKPTAVVDGEKVELSIIFRDKENDLVLLRSPLSHKRGVQLNGQELPAPAVGRFLISPDPKGLGRISIWSSSAFASPKRASRGYLGVVPADFEDGGALLDDVFDGAARKAGLQIGDVIKQMNNTPIESSTDLRRFLTERDPSQAVTAIILRDGEQFEKNIVLGAAPSETGHTADLVKKSGRRDGFERVFAHDAVLKPDECGGPLYDLQGNFVGLNIARHSRVRTFAIPAETIRQFFEAHSDN